VSSSLSRGPREKRRARVETAANRHRAALGVYGADDDAPETKTRRFDDTCKTRRTVFAKCRVLFPVTDVVKTGQYFLCQPAPHRTTGTNGAIKFAATNGVKRFSRVSCAVCRDAFRVRDDRPFTISSTRALSVDRGARSPTDKLFIETSSRACRRKSEKQNARDSRTLPCPSRPVTTCTQTRSFIHAKLISRETYKLWTFQNVNYVSVCVRLPAFREAGKFPDGLCNAMYRIE